MAKRKKRKRSRKKTRGPAPQSAKRLKAKTEEPKTEGPKTDGPKTEEPKTEGPKTEEPKTEGPKTEGPKTEGPKTEEPKTEGPKTEGEKLTELHEVRARETRAERRARRLEKRRFKAPLPRRGFLKGAACGLVVAGPLDALLLHALAESPLERALSLPSVLIIAASFAGLPSIILYGGIGRFAARVAHRGRLRTCLVAASLGLIAGAGTMFLAALPMGAMGTTSAHAASVLGAGAGVGALAGAIAGLWLALSPLVGGELLQSNGS
jgi:hypothetical protein